MGIWKVACPICRMYTFFHQREVKRRYCIRAAHLVGGIRHYYLTYFVLPIVLLSCFSFIDDDGEPVILRFQSYHSYFLKKWIGVGLIAVILTAVQTGAILLSGIGLPLGNEWNLAAGATEAELFSTLEQLFASP